MTFRTCPHEDRILAATRTGELSNDLRAHVADCEACAAALEAERAMGALGETLTAEARSRLAPPDVILLRAKLRARREAAERSLRPLELWQWIAAVAAGIGLAIGLALSGSLFGALVHAPGQVDPSQLRLLAGLAALAALPFVRRHSRPA